MYHYLLSSPFITLHTAQKPLETNQHLDARQKVLEDDALTTDVDYRGKEKHGLIDQVNDQHHDHHETVREEATNI